jgi:predicted dehydrogenase
MVEIKIHVEAENGTMMVNDDMVNLYLEKENLGYSGGWTTYRKPDLFNGVEIDVGGGQYTRQDRIFIDAVRKGEPVECDVLGAYRVQEVTDAIYESARNAGRRVAIGKRGWWQ